MPGMLEEVLAGLTATTRAIPPKYFYDDHGSLLFDRICSTQEYYLTRTETDLLISHGTDIIATTRPAQILELGSGISHKVRLLLDACGKLSHTCEYAPFDVCEEMVDLATNRLAADYPWLSITPLLGDYHAGLGNLPKTGGVRLLAFLGSSIGNFTAAAGREFVRDIRLSLQPGDFFLLGADRVKSAAILHAAYNDADGITAEFNLNILRVLNSTIQANFDLDNFSHSAVYNADLGQIEMYLIAKQEQKVQLGKAGISIRLAAGERILTEISRKYGVVELESMFIDNDFKLVRHYQPDNQWYSLLLAQVPG
ncbi:MAG: Dimethylhistidine N-methyltransferase [Gammaproteobacteria bacterium]|nr:Dimethylhistidine N-methyltransferase [Gammaproteobacteria bacterium]